MKTLYLVLFVGFLFAGCAVYPVGYPVAYGGYAAPQVLALPQGPTVAPPAGAPVYLAPQPIYVTPPMYAPYYTPYYGPPVGFYFRFGGGGHHHR